MNAFIQDSSGRVPQNVKEDAVIDQDVLQLFGTQVQLATSADAAALQDSLDKTVSAADKINTAVSGIDSHPQINEVADAAGQLAGALGAADSLSDLQQKAADLSQAVNKNVSLLGEKRAEGETRVADVVNKVETAVNSWENVRDLPSLDKAVKDTGTAASSLGGFLTFLGGILTPFVPAIGIPLAAAGAAMILVGDTTAQVADQVAPIVKPQPDGDQTDGKTTGKTGGRTGAQADGKDSGKKTADDEQSDGKTDGEQSDGKDSEEKTADGEPADSTTDGRTDGPETEQTDGPNDGPGTEQTDSPTDIPTDFPTIEHTDSQITESTDIGTDLSTAGTDFQVNVPEEETFNSQSLEAG